MPPYISPSVIDTTDVMTNAYAFFGDENPRLGVPDNRGRYGSLSNPVDITSPVLGDEVGAYLPLFVKDPAATVTKGPHPTNRTTNPHTSTQATKQLMQFGPPHAGADLIHVQFAHLPGARSLSLGKILTPMMKEISVWNSWATSKKINGKLVIGQATGVSDDLTLPMTLNPGQEKMIELTISDQGDRLVNAALVLTDDSGGPSNMVSFLASRTVDFWIIPDWERGAEPSLSMKLKTDAFVGDTLKEQRSTPARDGEVSYELGAAFKTSGMDGKAVLSLIHDVRGDIANLPFFPEPFQTSTTIVPGSTSTITATPRPLNTFIFIPSAVEIAAGAKIIRVDERNALSFEIRTISAVNIGANTITVTSPWSLNIPKEFALFHFMVQAALVNDTRVNMSDSVEVIETSWVVI